MTNFHSLITIGIFFLVYLLICFESFHNKNKTVIVLCGATLILILQIMTPEESFYSTTFGVDWHVIFLLFSMMIIANIMKPTGVFEYIAIKSVKIAQAQPYKLLIIISLVTAFISAFIDNVTTILLIAPVILSVTNMMEIDPIPFLISIVLSSNIGGTATLIGDPPNIMIASKANLNFIQFIYHLTPVIIIIMVIFLIMIKFLFGKHLIITQEQKNKIIQLEELSMIKDKPLIKKSLIVLCFLILGFIFHDQLHLDPSVIALLGASILLMLSNHSEEPSVIFADVEWTSIFFFIGLFIVIGAVVKSGFIKLVANNVVKTTCGNIFKTSTIILWFSAVFSAIVDNIPFVATMNPLILDIAKHLWPNVSNPEILHQTNLLPIWWSLSLGACLGGNGTIIGASANIVVASFAEKAGKKISFWKFMLYAFPIWFMSIVISQIYIWLRYFYFNR